MTIPPDREMLETLQYDTFEYFLRQSNPKLGMIADSSRRGAPASIAAIGLGLSSLCVAASRGWMPRVELAARALATLQFFADSPQGPEADATGFHGFYYHFLDMDRGRRANASELSTIDTALLIAGCLTVAGYFDGASRGERKLRQLAEELYRRVDWRWACNGAITIGHGWTPEHGFLASTWSQGYDEALLLYVLALGAPTFAIEPTSYHEWSSTFESKTIYDLTYVYAGPLFIHQLPQVWLELRGVRDDRNRQLECDYFENSRRATLVHQRYALANPQGWKHYSRNEWGITASDGPGPSVHVVDGVRREFFGYTARGAPFGPDDGTIAPWAVVASLPFAPDEVCATVRHAIERLALKDRNRPGFDASFNATFPERNHPHGWVAPDRLGLNEGPIVLMIENHLTQMIWRAFRRNPFIAAGLRRAGFRGGWLDDG